MPMETKVIEDGESDTILVVATYKAEKRRIVSKMVDRDKVQSELANELAEDIVLDLHKGGE